MEQTSHHLVTAKASENAASRSQTQTSIKKLIALYSVWKLVLLAIAAVSPGPGYDTSTQLLLRRADSSTGSSLSNAVEHLVSKLTRWDAIYFASSSERGQVFEQEWAFSGTFAKLTSSLAGAFPSNLCNSAITCHALAGIVTSHITHLLAVLLLYKLTYEIIPSNHDRKRQIAFAAARLHILSPAGLFLSAPYGESMFAAAHIAGLLCYVFARKHTSLPGSTSTASSLTVLSGLLIGFSSMIRSNGLLSGCIFAWDAILYIPQLPIILQRRSWTHLLNLTSTLLAGLLIAIGYILPQYSAYREYCTLPDTRPWCSKTLPSIYTFVQSHYWNVGFLHYWTLSNLPLFLLAAPMLAVLAVTAIAALRQHQQNVLLARLALPQLVLTALATTSFHVQIVNRISSGYPVWYILIAGALCGNEDVGWLKGKTEWIVRGAIVYAVVQGGLYASFMPPA